MNLKEETISEYASLYFLRELLRGKSHLYQTIEETVYLNLTQINWINELEEHFTLTDKQVRKENKRRNIHLDNDIYKDIFFNFTTTINFHHIKEFYTEVKKGDNDDMMVDYEDMNTFPDTYDQ